MIIWLIGLSGSGKSTVARRLLLSLRDRGETWLDLDGDVLRQVWGDSPGYDIEGRRVNAGRISRLCEFLDRQGINAVAAVLSIFPDWQAWNRRTFQQYFEVFLDAPLELVRERDSKGLYRNADAGGLGQVVGVDIPFPRPPNPDLVLREEDLRRAPEWAVTQILQQLPVVQGSR